MPLLGGVAFVKVEAFHVAALWVRPHDVLPSWGRIVKAAWGAARCKKVRDRHKEPALFVR